MKFRVGDRVVYDENHGVIMGFAMGPVATVLWDITRNVTDENPGDLELDMCGHSIPDENCEGCFG